MKHDLKKSLYEYFNGKENRTEQEEEFLSHFKEELDFYDIPFMQLAPEDMLWKGYTLFDNDKIEEVANDMNDYLMEEFFFYMESVCDNLGIPKINDLLDQEIYSIYKDAQGVKQFKWEGYIYACDKEFRRYEPCWCEFPLSEILDVINEGKIKEFLNEWASNGKSGIEEINYDSSAAHLLNKFYNGKAPERLLLSELTMDTPCGCYIDY